MRIKNILLNGLILAVFLPTVALAQQQPTKTGLYDQCMRRTDRPVTPNYGEEARAYQARVKERHGNAITICLCEADVQMKWLGKFRAMGFDGNKKTADKLLKNNPALQQQLMEMSVTMNAEEKACFDNVYN